MASALSSSIAHPTAASALAPPSSSSSSSSSRFFCPNNIPLVTLTARQGRRAPSVPVVSAIVTSSFADTSASTSALPPASPPAPSTLYDVLRIPKTASHADIKSAFRRLALQNHPDAASLPDKEACTRRFLQIHSAYVALSNPQTRARYDLQLSLQHSSQPTGGNFKTRFSKSGNAVSTKQYRPSSSYSSPLGSCPLSSGRGRSWETDQCWC